MQNKGSNGWAGAHTNSDISRLAANDRNVTLIDRTMRGHLIDSKPCKHERMVTTDILARNHNLERHALTIDDS